MDDDEVQFLELVDKNKMDLEKKQMLEEEKELNDFRVKVATLQEETFDKVSKVKYQTVYIILNKPMKVLTKLRFHCKFYKFLYEFHSADLLLLSKCFVNKSAPSDGCWYLQQQEM